eukprot:TRINITY_DN11643_c0_g1_i1.p1 TRINITY_DN11643_c0_g1~~TRINITY_DN11643_c0_g1_i1.p1  ORF type:complete len:567 (-),score=88.94 TRINITY_DN11643_c0_g1_i1:38-1684(-)
MTVSSVPLMTSQQPEHNQAAEPVYPIVVDLADTEVCFKLAGNDRQVWTVKLNRNILVESGFFRAQFTTPGLKAERNDLIVINDWRADDFEAAKCVLHYLYSKNQEVWECRVEILWDCIMAEDLLLIPKLRTRLHTLLKKHIEESAEICVQFLLAAYMWEGQESSAANEARKMCIEALHSHLKAWKGTSRDAADCPCPSGLLEDVPFRVIKTVFDHGKLWLVAPKLIWDILLNDKCAAMAELNDESSVETDAFEYLLRVAGEPSESDAKQLYALLKHRVTFFACVIDVLRKRIVKDFAIVHECGDITIFPDVIVAEAVAASFIPGIVALTVEQATWNAAICWCESAPNVDAVVQVMTECSSRMPLHLAQRVGAVAFRASHGGRQLAWAALTHERAFFGQQLLNRELREQEYAQMPMVQRQAIMVSAFECPPCDADAALRLLLDYAKYVDTAPLYARIRVEGLTSIGRSLSLERQVPLQFSGQVSKFQADQAVLLVTKRKLDDAVMEASTAEARVKQLEAEVRDWSTRYEEVALMGNSSCWARLLRRLRR